MRPKWREYVRSLYDHRSNGQRESLAEMGGHDLAEQEKALWARSS